MNVKNGCAYPPLTPADIFLLRGKPAAKSVLPGDSETQCNEEWIYYPDTTTKEHYIFQNGRLISWYRIFNLSCSRA